MKIKYLKNTHDSKIGDVKDIPDDQAKLLITVKVAKEYQEIEPVVKKPRAPRKPKDE